MGISRNLDMANFVPTVEVEVDETTVVELDILRDNFFEWEWETVNKRIRIPQDLQYRYAKIANILYEEPNFWWVLILANDVDPVEGFEIGEEIIAPRQSEINEFLEKYRQDQ